MIVVESIINNVTYSVELGDVSTLSVSQAIAAKDTAEQVAQMVSLQKTAIDGIASTVTQDRQATQALRNETEGIKNAAVTETTAIKDEAVAQTASNLAQTIAKTQEAETARANAVAAASSATAVVLGQGTGRPNRPFISFNAVESTVLDSRFICGRTGNATRINERGIIVPVAANTPRFFYNPTTLQPEGLAIERPSTNLVNENQEFTTPTGTIMYQMSTDPNSINPLGFSGNVREAVLTQVGGRAQNNTTVTTSSFIWGSIFIQKTVNNELLTFAVGIHGIPNSDGRVTFNTTTGQIISTTTGTVFEVVNYATTNNWRVMVRSLLVSDNTNRIAVLQFFPMLSDGTAPVGTFFRYSYMQIETGITPTSLILGNLASRGEEAFLLNTTFFNQNIGSVYVEINRNYSRFGLSSSGRIVQFQGPWSLINVSDAVNVFSNFGMGASNVPSGVIDNRVARVAASYVRNTRLKLCADGSSVNTRSITGIGDFTRLVIGGSQGINHFNGFIRKFSLYNFELSDAEMVALTQNTFLGNQGDKAVGHNELGSMAYVDAYHTSRMPTRMTLPFFGNGTNQTYSFTLDFDCEIVTIHTTGSTFTRPTGVILAGTSITITHNAPVGTVMFLAFLPIIQ